MDPTDLENEHTIILDALKVVRKCHERNLIDVGLDRTLNFACAHFAHEESLMSVLDDGERTQHCREHDEMAIRLAEMKGLNLHGEKLRNGLVTEIENWVHIHISTYDALLVRKLGNVQSERM